MERLDDSESTTRRILSVVRGPDWDFLQSLVSIEGNPFKTPVVTEIKPKPPDPPDFEPPQSDAIAA